MLRLGDIVDKVLAYNPGADVELLRKAYVFSAMVHQGQMRRSGEPYLSHPLEVTGILADLHMDTVTVAVGLLHDTVEDTLTSLKTMEDIFGPEVSTLVDGVTKISKIAFGSAEEQEAENFRKMILAMAKDIRVIVIKLADRLHNMRTLQYMPPEKQKLIAQETMDIYAPLANRLGMAQIKWELDDLAFRYTIPNAYKELEEQVNSNSKECVKEMERAQELIQAELTRNNLPGRIEARLKHLYSIYLKMKRKDVSFENVMDLAAMRVITDTIPNCYGILGVIHSLWKPIPGGFDDYIAMPKPNLYQSLHTTVIGPEGRPLEIQIRTEEMHRIANEGIAAHWRYKEKGKVDDKYYKKFAWLQHLMEWQQDVKDPRDFLQAVKTELFPDEVYVFTPKGEVKSLPRGATPIDFAYSVHSDVGHHCVGAKVNGRLVPLRSALNNGDIIEILTQPNHHPSSDWLKIVKTSRAVNRIRHWVKMEQRQRSIALGREICERELQKNHLNYGKLDKAGGLLRIAEEMGFRTVDDLMVSIGYGKTSVHQIVSRLIPHEEAAPKESRFKKIVNKMMLQTEHGVKVKGVDDLLINLAKCCNPVTGDQIVGFITRGRGVTIHRINCPNAVALSADPERKIEVEWGNKVAGMQSVAITVQSGDRPGLLAEITNAISKTEANIVSANVSTSGDKQASHHFVVQVQDLNHLNKIIKAIEQIKDVFKVERVRAT